MLKMDDIERGHVRFVVLSGRIDSSNSEALTAHLKAAIVGAPTAVVVDLKEVAYLTSAAFRSLLVATDEAERAGIGFSLCGIKGYVRELFEMGGLLDTFTVWDDQAQAMERLPP